MFPRLLQRLIPGHTRSDVSHFRGFKHNPICAEFYLQFLELPEHEDDCIFQFCGINLHSAANYTPPGAMLPGPSCVRCASQLGLGPFRFAQRARAAFAVVTTMA